MSRVLLSLALLVSIASAQSMAGDAPEKPKVSPPWWMADGPAETPPKKVEKKAPPAKAKGPVVPSPWSSPPAQPPQVYQPTPGQPPVPHVVPYAIPPQYAPPVQPTYPPASPPKRKRIVYTLKNVPAADVAKTVGEFLKAEKMASLSSIGSAECDVVITPEMITNSLLVSGPEEELEELGEVIKRLDAEPTRVSIDVLIAEVAFDGPQKGAQTPSYQVVEKSIDAILAELGKSGRIRMLARPSVATISNQAAFVKIGERKPRVTGSSTGPRGHVNTMSMEDIGLVLGLTPRVNTDGLVTMEIDIEQSYFGDEKEGVVIGKPSEGEAIRAASIETVQLQTTASARSGQTVVLGGLVRQDKSATSKTTRIVMFVTPHVISGEND